MSLSICRSPLSPLLAMVALLSVGHAELVQQVSLNSQERAIFNHLAGDTGQQRPSLRLDPTLCAVARARANDMGQRGYYDHTDPNGHGPNWWVEHAGYPLPASYNQAPDGNNIESIAAGYTDPDDVWSAWMDSAPHRQHLLATHPFFVDQTSVGIGYAHVPGSDWGSYWVVITAPPPGPTLTIASPASNSRLTTPEVLLTGSTAGSPAAGSVQACVSGGEWFNATGTSNWNVTLSGLIPGDNVLHVRSLSASGEVLGETHRRVHYAMLAPLTVQINGMGKVMNGFAGTTQREVGENYRVTAIPAPGWLFESWTGGLAGPKPTVSFTMAQGLAFAANFVPNPFIASAGGYAGMLSSGDPGGLVRLKLAATGAFTARVRYSGGLYVLAGSFDLNGDAVVSAQLPGGGSLLALFHLETTGGGAQISGTLSAGASNSAFTIDPLGGAPQFPNNHAGRYTLVLQAPEDGTPATPDGDGIATLNVDGHGAVTLGIALADGTPVNAGGTLTAGGDLVIYLPLYGGKGLLAGILHFRDTGSRDIDGALFWSKPERPKGAVCRDSFALTTSVVGSRYTPPPAGQPALAVTSGADNTALAFGGGDLGAPLEQPATLGMDNSVVPGTPVVAGLRVALKPGSGHFTGTFVHPVSGATTILSGVILQKQNAGFGFFLGTDASGYATLAPVGQ